MKGDTARVKGDTARDERRYSEVSYICKHKHKRAMHDLDTYSF